MSVAPEGEVQVQLGGGVPSAIPKDCPAPLPQAKETPHQMVSFQLTCQQGNAVLVLFALQCTQGFLSDEFFLNLWSGFAVSP